MAQLLSSDALLITEDWISEHYFSTDAKKESFNKRVLDRRRDWEDRKAEGTVRTRFTAARAQLLNQFATLDRDDADAVRALNAEIMELLGFTRAGLIRKTDGPVTFIYAAGIDQPGLAIIDALPGQGWSSLVAKAATNLTEPFDLTDPSIAAAQTAEAATAKPDEQITSVARLISHLFITNKRRPDFVLVLAGPQTLIAERERWPEGRWLGVDLQLVAERADDKRGGEVDRALTCLSAESLAPDAEGDIWWSETLEESIKHTVGVSQDLRDGVRLSIEIIANEVVRRRKDQELDPLPQSQAQPLAKQALRFLYRILFLLYAEASPELGVLPSGAPEYERGYSLDRLRELILTPLTSPASRHGLHLYESLHILFERVDQGHDGSQGDPDLVEGLTFGSLRADLFQPAATALIDEVKLGNAALQQVLSHLLLSKAQKGKDRGFISYAELGINQLGAVYEGLMSYTGFFAETDLYEVAKGGDASKGSWVVPVERADGISASDFVMTEDEVTGEPIKVLHRRGTFVFRLAGRERQQSASYYTPEVLTRFTVSQALAELLDADGQTTTADELLQMTLCEPAMGSGAFAIEAVRQLAQEYLTRKQAELGQTIDPDDYPRQLQIVKAHFALHQVYGVDLNSTAVELAEISLWLDTMVAGLQAPWFGLHLRRGNSLVGARKQVYTRTQVKNKAFLTEVPYTVKTKLETAPGQTNTDNGDGNGHGVDISDPTDYEVDELESRTVDQISGYIPHFLLPADGWGAAVKVTKQVRDLVPDEVKELRAWARGMKKKPTKKQIDQLEDMGRRVEKLWQIATRRLEIAEQQIRRDLPVWGQPENTSAEPGDRIVTREEIEASLADPDGAYQRLRRVMDAWCALWYWPLTSEIEPPGLDQWYEALRMIVGQTDTMSTTHARKGDLTLDELADWDELGTAETNDRIYAKASPIDEVLTAHPWLRQCADIAAQQGFFHWELDFATVFTRGGFDLQLGNPPWVRPDWDETAALAEYDVRFALEGKMPVAKFNELRSAALSNRQQLEEVVTLAGDQVALRESVSAVSYYPYLKGLRPDLYRCFMELTWRNNRQKGAIGLIHPESHFTDQNAGFLRAASYQRLRRHWQFINYLKLFDIDGHVIYGVHIYRNPAESRFLMASWLYHPDTVERSLIHDGSGEEPGLKDETGNWDIRPHKARIQLIDTNKLDSWHHLVEEEIVPMLHSRMVYTVNNVSTEVLSKLSGARRCGSLQPHISHGWDESKGRKDGYFDREWGQPSSWEDVIIQGPHIHVGNPFYKIPNETMKNNADWSSVDLETLPPDAIPITSYKPRGSKSRYSSDYTHWSEGGSKPARDYYRVAWRGMAANTGERTLIPAIIPPGTAHPNGIFSVGIPGQPLIELILMQAVVSSIVNDFAVRAVPKSGIYQSVFDRLALGEMPTELRAPVILRTLRLNCLTDAYSDLWSEVMTELGEDVFSDTWTGGIDYSGRPALADVTTEWSAASPLRRDSDRRQALVEIDAIVALSLGVTADELVSLYRTQFPVLVGYDRNKYIFDTNGRIVPNEILREWRKLVDKAEPGAPIEMEVEARTATNAAGNTYTYELPFTPLDREADLRRAYAHFEQVLADG